MYARRHHKTTSLLYAALLAAGGCSADRAPQRGSSHQPLIMDELHNGGTEGFLFLPPMVPRPAHLGDIVPELPVTVRVDELDGNGKVRRTVATFTTTTGPRNERVRYHVANAAPDEDDDDQDNDPAGFYLARWRTADDDLSLSAIYRARVLVPARGGALRELGFADVDVVRNQKQFRSVDQSSYTPLINGETLRIKFRVDRAAVDGDGDGVLDWKDNCPAVRNADQADSLGTGVGDACRCAALPADFGGVRCTAGFASCDGGKVPLAHAFGDGKAVSAGLISVACAATTPAASPALAVTVHGAPLVVGCAPGVTFTLDPALGAGVHTAVAKGGGASYSLRYEHAFGTDAKPCAAAQGTCGSVRSDVHVALEDLRAQGLGNCRLFYAATATRGAVSVENGRVKGGGGSYPILAFDGVHLTGAAAAPTCDLHPLDGKALDGGPSAVHTRCGATAETSTFEENRLPTLCTRQAEGGSTVAQGGFADLHASYDDAPLADEADLGRLGQVAGAICPGGAKALNKVEAFSIPRPAGALQVTAKAELKASDEFLKYYRDNVDVSLAVKANGLPPLELVPSVSVAELEKGVALKVPDAYAKGTSPTTVVQGRMRPGSLPAPVGADQIICFLENGKLVCVIMDVDTGGIGARTQENGGPIDKLDLCLDVEVK